MGEVRAVPGGVHALMSLGPNVARAADLHAAVVAEAEALKELFTKSARAATRIRERLG